MIRIRQFDSVLRFDLARTIAGRGRYWTSAYLVDGLLIDSGCAYTSEEFLAEIYPQAVLTLVNTHSHEDHIGANGLIQRHKPGVKLFAHQAALPILSDPVRRQPLQPYRRLFWGYPLSSEAKPLKDGEWVQGFHYRFQVIHTPGHTADHICLFQPDQGWLFSGDLFIGGKDRALGAGYRIWDIIKSLKRVAELPLTWLFPGCARARQNPQSDLQAKIHYYEELGEKVLTLSAQGWEVSAIARKLLGKPMGIELVTGGHFSRRNLVRSFLQNKETAELYKF